MKSTSRLHVCVVGCGSFGKKRIESLLKLSDWECVGVYDINPKLALATGKRYDLPAFTHLHEMLALNHLDVAVICVPNAFHFELCEICLRNDLHVLCEKPLFIKPEEYQQFQNRESKKLIKMGCNLIHFPCMLSLQKIFEQQTFGRAQRIFASIGHNGKRIAGRWNTRAAFSGGGAMIDNGIHLLAFFQQINPDIQKVDGANWSLNSQYEVEDYAYGVYRMGEAQLVIEASWHKPVGYCELFIQTDRGELYVDVTHDWIEFKNQQTGETQTVEIDDTTPSLESELNGLAESIKKGENPHPSLHDAEKLYQLVQSSQTFKLSEHL